MKSISKRPVIIIVSQSLFQFRDNDYFSEIIFFHPPFNQAKARFLSRGLGSPNKFFAFVCADDFWRKEGSVQTNAMLAVNEVAESIARKKCICSHKGDACSHQDGKHLFFQFYEKMPSVATSHMLALNVNGRERAYRFFKIVPLYIHRRCVLSTGT